MNKHKKTLISGFFIALLFFSMLLNDSLSEVSLNTDLQLSSISPITLINGEKEIVKASSCNGGQSCQLNWTYCGPYQCDVEGPTGGWVCVDPRNANTCSMSGAGGDMSCGGHECNGFGCGDWGSSYCDCLIGMCGCHM